MRTLTSARVAAAIVFTGLLLATTLPTHAREADLRLAGGAARSQAQEDADPAAPSRDTLVPVLAGVIVVVVLGRRLLLLAGQRQAGHNTTGSAAGYGIAGGAICPGCARAFARHPLSPNLIAGKLSRCPHCGRWSIVPRASAAALAAAEATAQSTAPEATAPALSEEERLRRQIEASRYE